MVHVRPPAVAGSFYPERPEVLAREVDRLLAGAPGTKSVAPPKALIVPHAGYIYSGPIAATAYAQLRTIAPRIERVALFGPSHFVAVPGLALPDAAEFETPLWRIPLDEEAMARCRTLPQVTVSAAAHAREHSLEVQLPFLQRVLPQGFKLIPFSVGRARPADVAAVIELLADERTLILISSDLSHYLTYPEARTVDRATAEHILSLDVVAYDDACGAGPVNGVVTWARQKRLRPELLDLRNSGDTAGGKDQVVGYGAFAFTEISA